MLLSANENKQRVRKTKIIFTMLIISSLFLNSAGVVFAEFSEPGMPESIDEENGVDEEECIHCYEAPIPEGGPNEYTVGFLLANVGKIDREIGHYWIDFWVDISAEGVDFTKEKPQIDFINGQIENIGDEYTEKGYYEARIQGTFFNDMDFRDYPFEKILLKIEIEPVLPNDTRRLVFVVDPEVGIDSEANIPGWEIGEPVITVEDHIYDIDEAYSRFTAEFPVERSVIGSVLKTFLPVTIITAISLIVFFIPENFTPRIYLTAPLLLSLVYLHTGALKDLPPLGYMTLFDSVMIIYYALFINSILSLGIQMKYHVLQKPDKIIKANTIQRYLIPVIVGIGILIIAFR